MCGLNGIFAYQSAASDPSRDELIATREHMAARGPDGDGEWWSEDRRLALAFRRLAIQDLSPRAGQPMLSDDGRLAIVFNGEIYNFRELRAELEQRGRRFRTTSDTEVLLHLYALEGEAMVGRLRGMFAFAIWDQARRGLFLARDPYGIKPLYTANDGWTFRFASQVKALLAGGRVSRDPESAGVVGFHIFGSVPEPFTLYRDIHALPAGHTQWVSGAGPREPKPYVSIPSIFADARSTPAPDDATAMIREAVLDSVRAHLIADVEVGLFLSSGVDSGAVLGLVRDAGQDGVTAITLSYSEFAGTEEDEAPLAAEMAARYGARHVVRQVSGEEFRAELPVILDAMDQPSIDGVNSWYVAKAGREAGLKVALSGLGGDELLGGYPSFRDLPRWTAMMRPLSAPGLGAGLRILAAALAPTFRRERPKALGLAEFGGTWPGAYLLRRGLFLPFELSAQLDPELVRDGLRRLQPVRRLARSLEPDPGSAFGRVSTLESTNYLKNQLLRDTDWTGMAHSLEVRTPLVDIELLKTLGPLLANLPVGEGKRALAAAPSMPLPQKVVDRAKSGFGVPLGDWLYPENARRLGKGAVSRLWAHDIWRNQHPALAA
jgi:asparagine synthase (glutamine-hydrolysing)